jgi:D-alanyl-D-alanine dipeptidase
MLASELVDVEACEPSIALDIRYATSNNFLKKRVYSEARALLQLPVAKALVQVHRCLASEGLGVVIFDAYRPASVTQLFWQLVPPDKRAFVADPRRGSNHNRGCSVDVSIYYLSTKQLAEMPSDYDEMTERASPDFTGCSELEREHRELLRRTMERHQFTVHPLEWWHFDHALCAEYPILDIPFEDIPRTKGCPT